MSGKGRIDFGDRSWSAHAQDKWLLWAGSPDFPDHLRIMFVAYGKHRANGHARLEREELRFFLVRRDGTIPDRRTVTRGIARAVDLGLIHDTSNALCLVVSSHDAQGGQGDPDVRCRRDHTKRPQRTTTADVVTQPRTTTTSVVTRERTTTADVVTLCSGPSLSSPTPSDTAADRREVS